MKFQITQQELILCQQAMSGQSGEVLIDVITDKLLLTEASTLEEALKRAGAGEVVKFLRALNQETDNFIETPK